MRFLSTRGTAPAADLVHALAVGLAPDGGLYLPATLPRIDLATLAAAPTPAAVCAELLRPFFADSPLATDLPALCGEAYAQVLPLRALAAADDYVLELFHGPTAAFKDIGARFLAAALQRLRAPGTPPLTILVATSGDTGAAVAAAFHHRGGFRVVILYPRDGVSARQAHQLGAFGDNVLTLRVAGSFDDCQRMAKRALGDAALRAALPLASANSISLGRLLPQAGYYAWAALQYWRQHARALSFIVPTGNLGNALACVIARRMGLPIGRIVLACNANDTLPRYFAGEPYAARPSRRTLANAMDVGAPSNFERLRALYADDAALRADAQALSVDDATITATLRAAEQRHGLQPCPHTATALHVLETLRAQGDPRDYAVVATAHPAKFPEVVEPAFGHVVETPPALAELLARPSHAGSLEATDAALRAVLRTR
ncbi:threonine synthase [Metallibacterium sp.]|uniref:threonine synthase n=1 Tax=Metallibacterium sp. TaxID=2940281 RepID=UPI00260832E3|nr:threonine synthase [Metallibacterium sp.]